MTSETFAENRHGRNGRIDLCLVHDYLIQMGGAERVVAAMSGAYPAAPIYTSITDYGSLMAPLRDRFIRNSVLHALPSAVKNFKKLFALYPMAFCCMRMLPSRAAWISTSMFAKCVRPHPETVTFCYMHNAPRFLWQPGHYIDREVGSPISRWIIRAISPMLRRLDYRATMRMDYIIANSENIARRIGRIYGREAAVIYPPVNVDDFSVSTRNDGYYLVLSRLIGYKRVDLAVEAFRGLDRKLIIAGDGTDRRRIKSLAGENVEVRGWVSEEERMRLLANTRALIFPGHEDFGITPVEAMACGKPVIAYNRGGAAETVAEGLTGVLFEEQTPQALRSAILRSEGVDFDPVVLRKNAERFSLVPFVSRMKDFIARHSAVIPVEDRIRRCRIIAEMDGNLASSMAHSAEPKCFAVCRSRQRYSRWAPCQLAKSLR